MPISAEMPASFVRDHCLNLSSDATRRGNAAAKRLESVSDGKQRPKAETGASRNASARTVCLNADSLNGRSCLRLTAFASRFEDATEHTTVGGRRKCMVADSSNGCSKYGRSTLPASHAGVCSWLGLPESARPAVRRWPRENRQSCCSARLRGTGRRQFQPVQRNK